MKTVLIPVEICEKVFSLKISKDFQLYLLFKSLCDGKMKIPMTDYQTLAAMLGHMFKNLLQSRMKKLLELDFIGNNKKSKYWFISGFDQIKKQLEATSLTSQHYRESGLISISHDGSKIYYSISDAEKLHTNITTKRSVNNHLLKKQAGLF